MLTSNEVSILEMFHPGTYAICLNRSQSKGLEDRGFIEWVPPVWGNTPNYAITEAGQAALESVEKPE